MSPVLVGEFLTTGPLGKSWSFFKVKALTDSRMAEDVGQWSNRSPSAGSLGYAGSLPPDDKWEGE